MAVPHSRNLEPLITAVPKVSGPSGPALAVPVMRSDAGLPVGVQLIGRRGEERTLIALARILEAALGGWLDPDAR